MSYLRPGNGTMQRYVRQADGCWLDARIVPWSPQVCAPVFGNSSSSFQRFTEQRLQSLVGAYCEDMEIMIGMPLAGSRTMRAERSRT